VLLATLCVRHVQCRCCHVQEGYHPPRPEAGEPAADEQRQLVTSEGGTVVAAVAAAHTCCVAVAVLSPCTALSRSAVVGAPQIADFGLSQLIRPGEKFTKVCGTWAYAAPEMHIPASGGYDFKYDTWSFGVILFVTLCGYHPFDPEGNLPVPEVRTLCFHAVSLCVRACLCSCVCVCACRRVVVSLRALLALVRGWMQLGCIAAYAGVSCCVCRGVVSACGLLCSPRLVRVWRQRDVCSA
jgi:hypothetical protein